MNAHVLLGPSFLIIVLQNRLYALSRLERVLQGGLIYISILF